MMRAAVLVVEDEPLMRMMAVDLVEEAGFEEIEAWSVDDALRILRSRDDIRIVFSDVDLGSGGNGLKLAHAVHDRWPSIGSSSCRESCGWTDSPCPGTGSSSRSPTAANT
ncbi:response regulator transcription factor [Lichenibacterium minor]|uniref:response regulator transcription factor n=1 Tax=Lichenibacterium minor TaxID=2316528 RepID=UPI001FE14A1B|nr:response regulator [Lichenibacterium minor]